MAVMDMGKLVDKDFPSVLLQVFPWNDNISHPTERSDVTVVYNQSNALFPARQVIADTFFLTRFQQHQQPHQRTSIAESKENDSCQINQQRHLYPGDRCRLSRYSGFSSIHCICHHQQLFQCQHGLMHFSLLPYTYLNQRQQARQQQNAQQRKPVETMKCITCQQQAIKQIEYRQTNG